MGDAKISKGSPELKLKHLTKGGSTRRYGLVGWRQVQGRIVVQEGKQKEQKNIGPTNVRGRIKVAGLNKTRELNSIVLLSGRMVKQCQRSHH